MWKYIKPYLPYAVLARLFMIGEVSMDLVQPGIMSQIVDDGVLDLNSSKRLLFLRAGTSHYPRFFPTRTFL